MVAVESRVVLCRRIARQVVEPVRVDERVVVPADARVQGGLAVAGDVPRQPGARLGLDALADAEAGAVVPIVLVTMPL